MKRIAAPMVGGLLSATVLTLIVIPAVFSALRGAGLPAAPARPEGAPTTEAGGGAP